MIVCVWGRGWEVDKEGREGEGREEERAQRRPKGIGNWSLPVAACREFLSLPGRIALWGKGERIYE